MDKWNIAAPPDNNHSAEVARAALVTLRALLCAIYGELEPDERQRVVMLAENFVTEWAEALP